ncbi:MAG: hypothetical protein IJ725_00070 [Ruminococcus sp.]|nr:hypothetical protein [Ruminococcus sp.]
MKIIKNKIELRRIKNSIKIMKENNNKIYIRSGYLIAIFLAYLFSRIAIKNINNQFFSNVLIWLSSFLSVFLTVIGTLIILTAIGTPKGTKSIETRLQNISFCDKFGKPPMLMRLQNNGKKITFTFYSPLIPKSDFQRKQEAIETALNVNIASIEIGKDLQEIIIEAIKGDLKLPDFIPWQDNYISTNDSAVALGETILDQYVLDFDKCIHCMIAGSTGSGKTALEKLIMYQFIRKKADVYLIDYKGGVDFPSPWDKYCRIVTSDKDFYNVLKDLKEIKDARDHTLKESGFVNIKQYNKNHEYPMKPILVAIDEMAAAMSTKCANKEEKALKAKIEDLVIEFAERGRYCGIHLLPCTQRPDATVLSGRIRSNIPKRFLGRADKNLADVVFENKELAKKIPTDEQGIFVDTDGKVFRAYYFEDSMWG